MGQKDRFFPQQLSAPLRMLHKLYQLLIANPQYLPLLTLPTGLCSHLIRLPLLHQQLLQIVQWFESKPLERFAFH